MSNTLYDPISGSEVYDAISILPTDLYCQNVLNHGYVRIIDVMPRLIPVSKQSCDFVLADAARVSYQHGTKKVNNDAGLIDNLVRNQHTSPLEQAELKFQLKMPILVARQLLRHRTASVNEESARYSVLSDEFYIPDPQHWAINTTADKQATQQVAITPEQAKILHDVIKQHNDGAYKLYKGLLGDEIEEDAVLGELLSQVPDIAREQARMVLGVNIYTSMVWKMDLKNLMWFLKLRLDAHAQFEIRVYAQAIERIVSGLFPITWKSYRDNFIEGISLSKSEILAITLMLECKDGHTAITDGWTERRKLEFAKKINHGFGKCELTKVIITKLGVSL